MSLEVNGFWVWPEERRDDPRDGESRNPACLMGKRVLRIITYVNNSVFPVFTGS